MYLAVGTPQIDGYRPISYRESGAYNVPEVGCPSPSREQATVVPDIDLFLSGESE